MTASQAAKKIGVSRQSLYNWLKHGHLVGPAKLGRNRRPGAWTNAHVEAARAARKTIPGPGGCKPRKVLDARLISRLRAQSVTWAAIARQLRCCVPVARRALQRLNNAL
jgi:predicted DNA-binding transcriptional regulator AlpA